MFFKNYYWLELFKLFEWSEGDGRWKLVGGDGCRRVSEKHVRVESVVVFVYVLKRDCVGCGDADISLFCPISAIKCFTVLFLYETESATSDSHWSLCNLLSYVQFFFFFFLNPILVNLLLFLFLKFKKRFLYF